MTTIIHRPVYSNINLSSLTEEEQRILYQELSYTEPNAFFINSWRSEQTGADSTWDGRVNLLYRNGNFPSGLFPRVCHKLTQMGAEYTVQEQFPHYPKEHNWQFNGELREYQEEAVQAMLSTNMGIVAAVVRSGKTLMAAAAISRLGIAPVVFLCHTIDVVGQTKRLFERTIEGTSIGVVADGECDIGDVTICTVQSAMCAFRLVKGKEKSKEKLLSQDKWQPVRELIEGAKIIIGDEIHHFAALEGRTVLKKAHSIVHQWGLSGSPWRSDGKDLLLEASAGPVVYKIDFSKLISLGYLVPATIFWVTLPKKRYPGGTKYQTFYNDYVVNNSLRNEWIVRFCRKMASEGKSTMVQVRYIPHGKVLQALMPEAILLTGKTSTKNRNKGFDDLRAKKELICITTLGGEAIDIKSLDCVAVAEGGKSSIDVVQRLRSLTADGIKTKCSVLDFSDQARFLSQHAKEREAIYRSEPCFTIKEIDGSR